jgi:hypothetical protein
LKSRLTEEPMRTDTKRKGKEDATNNDESRKDSLNMNQEKKKMFK